MKYRRDIDGLRAVAVLFVVVFHASPSALPGGFVGVDMFFVISGFLITGIQWDHMQADTFSFSAFYIRRAWLYYPSCTRRSSQLLSSHSRCYHRLFCTKP